MLNLMPNVQQKLHCICCMLILGGGGGGVRTCNGSYISGISTVVNIYILPVTCILR